MLQSTSSKNAGEEDWHLRCQGLRQSSRVADCCKSTLQDLGCLQHKRCRESDGMLSAIFSATSCRCQSDSLQGMVCAQCMSAQAKEGLCGLS